MQNRAFAWTRASFLRFCVCVKIFIFSCSIFEKVHFPIIKCTFFWAEGSKRHRWSGLGGVLGSILEPKIRQNLQNAILKMCISLQTSFKKWAPASKWPPKIESKKTVKKCAIIVKKNLKTCCYVTSRPNISSTKPQLQSNFKISQRDDRRSFDRENLKDFQIFTSHCSEVWLVRFAWGCVKFVTYLLN